MTDINLLLTIDTGPTLSLRLEGIQGLNGVGIRSSWDMTPVGGIVSLPAGWKSSDVYLVSVAGTYGAQAFNVGDLAIVTDSLGSVLRVPKDAIDTTALSAGVASGIAAHVAATDPHGDRAYFNAQKGAANGIATLDSGGQIPVSQIPPAALERLVVVNDAAARYALTTATVQNGDTVKQVDTNTLWFVVDQTQLSTDAGYVSYTAGGASSVAWSNITGVPDAVSSLTTDTYANIRTNYPAASNTGKRARCPELNCDVYSDGSNWLPVNGRATLGNLSAAFGIAPSGTIFSSGSGYWQSSSVGTNPFDRTYSEGLFLYFGATTSTPALTAGWYWVVMSDTHTGVIYNTSWTGGVPTIGSAITFTGSGTNTGVSGTYITIPEPVAVVPGNSLGVRGQLCISASFRTNATANAKYVQAKFGGTALLQGGNDGLAVPGISCQGEIVNRAVNSQGGTGKWNFTLGGVVTNFDAAIDSTLNQNVEINLRTGAATDWMICDRACCELARLS